jgi:FAD:protein FMN transferase
MNKAFQGLSRRDFLRLAAMGGGVLVIAAVGKKLPRFEVVPSYESSTQALGTTLSIRIEGEEDGAMARLASEAAFAEVGRLEKLLTRFPGGTEVCSLNQTGLVESPAPELAEVVRDATRFSDDTGGSFDITVEPVLEALQGFLMGQPFPPDSQFEAMKQLIDYERVVLSGQSLDLTLPGMKVTLDGIAEGYILDRAAATLRANNIRSALVNVGGSIAAVGGRGDGTPWEIGIASPLDPDQTIGTLLIKDQAVTTSGDYENYFTADKTYYHLIDPATARSPLYSHSATVVAASAAEADRIGVALMVDDPAVGPKLADGWDCEYLLYTRAAGPIASSGLKGLMS